MMPRFSKGLIKNLKLKFFNNKVINNIAWLIFDKVFVLLIGLIVIVKIANHFGPSEYGIYEYALSITTLLGVIVQFVDGRVVKKSYKGINDGEVLVNTTVAKIVLSLISFILGICILLLMPEAENGKFKVIYLLLLINNILLNLGFGIQNYFEYKLKSKNVVIAANIATILSSILQLSMISLGFSIISIVVII
ncbi:hypothetical protein V7138_23925, partial [Bacillus sp. JJ1533]|uniref:hypothetical protein n=1 Tax=Bacillus sp. JJ1533 TaxID=3122959 RepID=UPI002FFF04FA